MGKVLVFADTRGNPDVRALFDRAVRAVKDGTAQPAAAREGSTLRVDLMIDDKRILSTSVLEYALSRPSVLSDSVEFDAAQAKAFTESMRLLFGWNKISHTLQLWVQSRICEPHLENRGSANDPDWQLLPHVVPGELPESFLQFACDIAIGELKHGPSYAWVSAERIFGWVTAFGSDLPTKLKKHGTGDLPADLQRRSVDGATMSANDALAVVRISIKHESQEAYGQVLDYLCTLLDTTHFPRSYAIEFRGPTKEYLPIRGLPKKGVHQLFAAAARYPDLHPALERYARSAMREFEEYTNLIDENCATPGTFAVFALGLAGEHSRLVLDYLATVDGEHEELHAKFVEAYVDAHGFTPDAVAFFAAVAANIQDLKPRKIYPALIANRESLEALLGQRGNFGDASEPAWDAVRYAIWGQAAMQRDAAGRRGRKIIDRADPQLRPLYEAVFATDTEFR